MEKALAWNELAPEAVSWLMSRTENNEVTGKNMDLSVAFVSEGDASKEGSGEMLIIPQHQTGSLVYGSVSVAIPGAGGWKHDLLAVPSLRSERRLWSRKPVESYTPLFT
mmetsp:Transcript_8363/g.37385  ORF Transcript_8363/g.37385 Transcript_8363/m.37385 type:complete len:109 (+) Transcript_8363:256-582(+)